MTKKYIQDGKYMQDSAEALRRSSESITNKMQQSANDRLNEKIQQAKNKVANDTSKKEH